MALPNGITTTQAPSSFGVFLGPVAFAVAQCCLLAFHVVCAAYFIAAGLLYHVLPSTNFGKMLTFYSLTLNYEYFRRIGAGHVVIGALHTYMLVSVLGGVILRRACGRRLKQHAASMKRRVTIALVASFHQDVDWAAHPLWSRVATVTGYIRSTRLGKALLYVYMMLLSPRGFFGVEGSHFETLFLMREVTETVLQAIQAYQMSRLLPREQLNRFYVAVLVLNCWATPLLHRLFRGRNQAVSRLLCLLFDILLDFISAVGVPVVLTFDYMADYDPTLTDFPDSLWYNDAWLVRLMNDAPLVFLSSWLDSLSRLMFSLSMLSTIEDVKNLIKRKRRTNPVKKAATAPFSVPEGPPRIENPLFMAVITAPRHKRRKRIVRWAHWLMVVFGFVILCVQLVVETKPRPPLCVLLVRPWFVSRPACALMEVNCLVKETTHTSVEAMFDDLDSASLEHILIRHCRRVNMAPQLQSFHNLVGLKTYNTSLVSWGAEAAITQSHHPRLRFLYFVRTNFSNATLPVGLTSDEFPETLRDVEFCVTNLNRLPHDLHEHWSWPLTLFIEYGELTEYPPVLTRMRIRMLSLCHNKISMLPSDALTLPEAYLVAFTGNPISTIPELGNGARIAATEMYLDSTTIVNPLPTWVDEAFVKHTALFLGGSPFCVDAVLNVSSPQHAHLLERRPWLVDGRVDCKVYSDQSFYPLGVDVRGEEIEII